MGGFGGGAPSGGEGLCSAPPAASSPAQLFGKAGGNAGDGSAQCGGPSGASTVLEVCTNICSSMCDTVSDCVTRCVNEPDKVSVYDYAVIIAATLALVGVLHLLKWLSERRCRLARRKTRREKRKSMERAAANGGVDDGLRGRSDSNVSDASTCSTLSMDSVDYAEQAQRVTAAREHAAEAAEAAERAERAELARGLGSPRAKKTD
jgi:hypothetical protein